MALTCVPAAGCAALATARIHCLALLRPACAATSAGGAAQAPHGALGNDALNLQPGRLDALHQLAISLRGTTQATNRTGDRP